MGQHLNPPVISKTKSTAPVSGKFISKVDPSPLVKLCVRPEIEAVIIKLAVSAALALSTTLNKMY